MKKSISRYIKYIGIDSKKLKHEFVPETHAKTYSFLEEITSSLDNKSPETLLNTVVVVDVSDVDNDISISFDPISNSDSTGQIVSSLILAYPEVYWIILGNSFNKPQPQNGSNCEWVDEHFVDAINMDHIINLLKRHQNGYRPLFDPSGLRTWIKNEVLNKLKKDKNPDSEMFKICEKVIMERTEKCAIAMDEELPFIFLSGYIAYRFRYRCYMIVSKSEMDMINNTPALDKAINEEKYEKALENPIRTIEGLLEALQYPNFYDSWFKKNKSFVLKGFAPKLISETEKYRSTSFVELNPEQQVNILKLNRQIIEDTYPQICPKQKDASFEDLELLFPDMSLEDEKLINGSFERRDLDRRRLIYSFLPSIDDKTLIITGVQDNKQYVTKPLPGIYKLRKKMEEKGLLKNKLQNDKVSPSINQLKDVEIPGKDGVETRRHSAHNRILLITNILLNRARKIANEVISCQDALHTAVLALESKELLCGRSLTTSLEAVSLQHQMEVRAECSFYGVAHEIEVESRFKEIDSEVNKICGISEKHKSIQYAQSYNTQLEIVNNIRGVFNEYEQFDEEERCIIKVRWLRQQLHKYQSWPRWVYSKTIEWYLNLLMSTTGYIPWRLGLASLCWISLFAVVLTCCCPTQFSVNTPDFHASEFKQSSDLRALCRETTKKGFGKHIYAGINSVNRLNELLQVPNLYASMRRKYPGYRFSDAVNTLAQEYSAQRYLNLEADAQETIKKLNRCLLEERYLEITPKHDTSKLEGFRWSVFCKSTRLYLLTFLELSHQEELNGKSGLFWISILEIIVAHVHLGIFISYLFQKLARR